MRRFIQFVRKNLFEFWGSISFKDYKNVEICTEAIKKSIENDKIDLNNFSIQAETKIRGVQIWIFKTILPFLLFYVPFFIGTITLMFVNNKHQYAFGGIILLLDSVFFISFYRTFIVSAIKNIKVLVYTEQMMIKERQALLEERSKGQINMILIDQLLRKECNLPVWINNIDAAEIKEPLEALYNLNFKNVKVKSKDYWSINNIKLDSDNLRTTNKKYIRLLILLYKQTNESILLEKARLLKDNI